MARFARLEAALRESEDRYRRLFEDALTGDFLATPGGKILLCNAAFVSIYGFPSRRSAEHSKVSQFNPAEWPRLVERLRARGKINGHQSWHRSATGRQIHIVENLVGVFNERKELTQVKGYVFDDTERVRAETALQQSEADLREVQRLAHIGSWYWDAKTDAITGSDELLRIYGFDPATQPMPTFRKQRGRCHPVADWARVNAAVKKTMATGVGFEMDVRAIRNGTPIWVTTRSTVARDAAGKIVGLRGTVQDITARKQAEEQLQQTHAALERRVTERTAALVDAAGCLQAIMDTALVGIITTDRHGTIESLNPAAVQIFGYLPEEIVGHNISRLMVSPTQAQNEEFLVHQLKARQKEIGGARREVMGWRKDGQAIVLEFTMQEFAPAKRQQFVSMVRDITARKRLERGLLEAGERERQRIGHDLHDGLGQHLHALYYMAELLQRELKGESSPHALEAGRLSKMLAQALDLSRSLAHGLQPVNPVPEGLMMTLRELARRTRALYRVACQFDCGAPVLIHRHSAATHLYRIAQEAVNNAMKHGKASRIRIQLTGTPQRITLVIRDDGVGIRRRAKSAQGMGLHIMQYRADAIGGSLFLRRHPRGGTEVVCHVNRQALLSGANEVK